MKLIPAAIVLVATITSFAVSGCELFEGYKCPDDMDSWVKYELFMGRSGPNGDVVDDAEWTAFLDDVITPRFPDGLTVVDGYGQWRGESGEIQQEASKVIIIVAPRSDDANSLINEVSQEYKRQFEQESVLKVVSDACVGF